MKKIHLIQNFIKKWFEAKKKRGTIDDYNL